MRRGLGLVVVALLVAACDTEVTPSLKASTPTPAPAFIPVSQPFRLFTHCGILTTYFAGRHWHTTETLPGVKGPPYGDGQDSFTEVYGTLTIVDAEDAVFRSDAGGVVHFTALGFVGCD